MKYEKQVSLLIDLIPIIASDANFALKGGTAINLFYMELPRLSVDLDLVYLPIEARDISLPSIDAKLKSLKERLEKVFPYLRIRTNPAPPELSRQLICRREDTQIKIEVNTVIRGTLYPSVNKPLSQEVQRIFKKNAQMQIVSIEDLYGSKICAALDRQHPRDLFDIKLFFERYTLTREIFNAFLFYLISHNRPIAEVIRPTLLDISKSYEQDFLGMTKEPVSIESLLEARSLLIKSIFAHMSNKDKEFLLSVKAGEPNWSLLDIPNIEHYPSVVWKIKNVQSMSSTKRKQAYENLKNVLYQNTSN